MARATVAAPLKTGMTTDTRTIAKKLSRYRAPPDIRPQALSNSRRPALDACGSKIGYAGADMRKRLLYARSPEWAEMATRIDEFVGIGSFRALKTNARTNAGFIRDGEREAFVKRVAGGSWIKGMVDRIRGSRAARAMRGAAMLEAAGFAHPRPLAAAEARAAGAVYECYILSEPLYNARILSDFALRDGRNFTRRKWISEQVAGEIRRLHDSGLYTLDMQETNLMIAAAGARITVYFVDLEDFRRRRVTMR